MLVLVGAEAKQQRGTERRLVCSTWHVPTFRVDVTLLGIHLFAQNIG